MRKLIATALLLAMTGPFALPQTPAEADNVQAPYGYATSTPGVASASSVNPDKKDAAPGSDGAQSVNATATATSTPTAPQQGRLTANGGGDPNAAPFPATCRLNGGEEFNLDWFAPRLFVSSADPQPSELARLKSLGGHCSWDFGVVRSFRLNSSSGSIKIDGNPVANGTNIMATGQIVEIMYPPNDGSAGFEAFLTDGPTPTATATKTPSPGNCSNPRPRVVIETTEIAAGKLQVKVTVTNNAGHEDFDNRIRTIGFTRTDNALVNINDQTGRSGAFTVTYPIPPNDVQTATFVVRRTNAGPYTVRFTVDDKCDPNWSTFVGHG